MEVASAGVSEGHTKNERQLAAKCCSDEEIAPTRYIDDGLGQRWRAGRRQLEDEQNGECIQHPV